MMIPPEQRKSQFFPHLARELRITTHTVQTERAFPSAAIRCLEILDRGSLPARLRIEIHEPVHLFRQTYDVTMSLLACCRS